MIRRGIKRYFRLFRRGRDTAAQVDEEIRLHLELRVEQLRRAGYSEASARVEAQRRFGAVENAKQQMQQRARRRDLVVTMRDWLADFGHDVRYVLRGLLREPAFALVVVVTLALGIGANAAMFGVVDRLLLRGPEHVVDADRVMRVYLNYTFAPQPPITTPGFGYSGYKALRDGTRSFEGMGAYANRQLTLNSGISARRIKGAHVTPDLFTTLGVQPVLGRFWTEQEDRAPRGDQVVVLGHALWKTLFGGSADAIGRTVEFGGRPYTVIGVAPVGFTGPELDAVDAWLPMSVYGAAMTDDWDTAWDMQWLKIVARLKPGVSIAQAATDLTTAHRAAYPGDEPQVEAGNLLLAPLLYNNDGREPAEVAVSRWLIGVSAIVLLIACANIANLLLARSIRRRREVAVRVVLGISRGRLSRMLLTETFVLAICGALAGLVVAHWGGSFIRNTLLPDVLFPRSPVDLRVFVFSLLAGVLTALLIGLLPLFHARGARLAESIRSGNREGGGRRSLTRASLTIAQAALSVTLLIGAGLFVRSLLNVRSLDLGIDADRILVIWPSWALDPTLSEDERMALRVEHQQHMDDMLAPVQRVPGVESVSSSVGLPFQSEFRVSLRVPGYDSLPRIPGGGPFIAAVGPDYFATVGTRIMSGRPFGTTDHRGSEPVAIVNEMMARTLWPGEIAVGKCLHIGDDDETSPCARIVGIAGNARRFSLREEQGMQYYVPLGQEVGIGGRMLLVRAAGDPRRLIPQIRTALFTLDPGMSYLDIETLQETIDPQVRPWRLGASMFVAFGALALLIAAIGLYSLIAYLVSSRTQELGVRLALGAQPRHLVTMILRQGAALAAAGIAIGLVIALFAARYVEPLLFDASARDPKTFAAAALLLLITAFFASVLPARRATRVDPLNALRSE